MFHLENPGELEPTEWNPLFTENELEGLEFLDPTTGAPANGSGGDHSYPVSPTTPVTPGGYGGQADGHGGKMEEDQVWLSDQARTVEHQQQLQQQKLLELEQVCELGDESCFIYITLLLTFVDFTAYGDS